MKGDLDHEHIKNRSNGGISVARLHTQQEKHSHMKKKVYTGVCIVCRNLSILLLLPFLNMTEMLYQDHKRAVHVQIPANVNELK